ncbi:MAG: gliding motility-associated C-terminal domain-containing protein [Bacteroidetes bacterium]|nr:gliding motility-associated C-terminal domain-containing protein [Bacteroidota bacterium]
MAGNASGVGPLYLLVKNGGGSDGNTVANDCGRFLLSTDTLAIFYVDNFIPVNLGSDLNICSFDPIPTLDCGYQNLSYQWFDQSGAIAGATGQTYTPTVSGVYSVAINNGPSCTGADTVALTIIPAPSDNLGSDLTLCVNDPLPTLDAGNPGATYQWYLNNVAISGATLQTYTPSGLTPGVYTFTVEVNTGNVLCIGSFDIVITTTNAFNVTLNNQTICDISSAYPLLDAGNPGAPSYQWFLNSSPIAGATSQTYQTMQAGTYSVQVGTGTCAGNANMVLTVNATPAVTLANSTICDYDVIPTLDAGTLSNATYQWFNGGTSIGGATNSTYTPTGAGSYSVDVTIPPGCTGSGNMTLTINAAPVFTVSDQDICSDGQANLDAGIAGATYAWSNGGNTQAITTSAAGTYSVVVSLNNCSATDTAIVTVYNYPVAPTVACNPGTSPYKFVYVWTAVAGVASYEVSEDGGVTWIPANLPSGPESHGVNVTIPDFTVRAIGSGLCKTGAASDPTACEVTIPNIFTPNGDGKNEFFEIDNIEQYPNNNVQIFNRWGKEVYNEGGYNNSTKKFDGKDSPDGVYFYIVDLGNGVKAKAGTVTINR